MANRIRDVWASNLEAEMREIRDAIEKYPYIAMDTEFPGVVARPIGSFKTSSDYHYQTMRCNVDLLKIIQIGITLCDDEGHFSEDVCSWQFNFQFDIQEDMYSHESIELLHKSGIDFRRHEAEGIQPKDFAEMLITSGLVLCEDPKWVSFHSGYDFGYLVKLLTCTNLPSTEDEFFDIFSLWFPTVYDVKYMLRACKGLKGGLQEVADDLGVMRIGPTHQAGSDSLLTAATFFKMRELYFNDQLDDDEYNGKLYGLGKTALAALVHATNGQLDPSGVMNLGMGVGSMSGLSLRSGATIAERERTPLPRDATTSSSQQQQQQQAQAQAAQTQGQTPSLGALTASSLSASGLSGFPSSLGTPYGAMPNGPYGRSMGDR